MPRGHAIFNLMRLTLSIRTGERALATHVLSRLAFGPRPGDVDRVAAMGVDRWIDEQLHPERIADRAFPAIADPKIPERRGRVIPIAITFGSESKPS